MSGEVLWDGDTDGSAIGVDVGERSLRMQQYGGTYMPADAVVEATKKHMEKGKAWWWQCNFLAISAPQFLGTVQGTHVSVHNEHNLHSRNYALPCLVATAFHSKSSTMREACARGHMSHTWSVSGSALPRLVVTAFHFKAAQCGKHVSMRCHMSHTRGVWVVQHCLAWKQLFQFKAAQCGKHVSMRCHMSHTHGSVSDLALPHLETVVPVPVHSSESV
eukprot:1160874-Pelagomonas_calceolata.AAC.11